ncbi:unnamed protein product [Phytophthora fragariaefolia]|uniref:Unnamed protein product n=1 Tax=Phytophthora fragariaefolia TaxID=1490495 RepID=A0A9W6XYL1_9STRA|nr:unnamed protein product [Phytophthora fragariaefolia]
MSTEQYAVPSRLVTLYFAKKKEGGNDKWLTSDATLDQFLKKDEEMTGIIREVIHILVEVPDAAFPMSVPVVPIGPKVELHSCDHLLAFLENDMTDKKAIVLKPHILVQETLEFRLVGREQAIDTASKCFSSIVAHAKTTACDHTQVAIPVCSGFSGLGRTRMLEKGGTILERMKLDPKYVVHAIVPYCNEFNPQSEI